MSEGSRSQTIELDALTGPWRSEYVYPSSGRAGEFTGEHDVQFRIEGNRLLGASVADLSGSQLSLEFEVEGRIATGTWREKTSPTGYYQGRVFHGVLQLAITADHQAMEGKWLGFGSDLSINTGVWRLSRKSGFQRELNW